MCLINFQARCFSKLKHLARKFPSTFLIFTRGITSCWSFVSFRVSNHLNSSFPDKLSNSKIKLHNVKKFWFFSTSCTQFILHVKSHSGQSCHPVYLSFLAELCFLFNFDPFPAKRCVLPSKFSDRHSKRSFHPPPVKTADSVFHIAENLQLEIIIVSSSRVSPIQSDEYFRWIRVYVLEEPAPATNSISFVSRYVSSLFRKSFRSCRVSYNLVCCSELNVAEC